LSGLLSKLEGKIEKKVTERMGPILNEMRKVYEERKKVNKNLEDIKKLLGRG